MSKEKVLECFSCSYRAVKRPRTEREQDIIDFLNKIRSGEVKCPEPSPRVINPEEKRKFDTLVSAMKAIARDHTGSFKLVDHGQYIDTVEVRVPFLSLSDNVIPENALPVLLESDIHINAVSRNCLKISATCLIADPKI